MKKTKKNWRNAFLPFVLGFALSGLTAQEKEENKNVFTQPPYIIELNNSDHLRSKSTQSIQQDTKGLFKRFLKLAKENEHIPLQTETDELGFTHEKCQQTYKGVPVEFGIAVISRKNGKAQSIHGEYYNVTNIKTSPSITANQALQRAITHIGAQKYAWQDPLMAKISDYKKPEGELIVLPNLDFKNEQGVVTKFDLAYKFDIYATQPTSRGNIYIDAHTGKKLRFDTTINQGCSTHTTHTTHTNETNFSHHVSVLETFDKTKNSSAAISMAFVDGTADTRYSGRRTISTTRLPNNGNYILHDTSRGDGIHTYNLQKRTGDDVTRRVDFTDNDNNWTSREHNNANKDNAALDLHWGLGRTYDYFNTVHRRNSYNGNGAILNAYAHVGDGVENASWNNNALFFGDGLTNPSGTDKSEPLVGVGVVAHEFGHALDQETSNLTYQGESGALDEGLADIWGAMVEHFAKGNGSNTRPANSIWAVLDEEIRTDNKNGVRSMQNPKLFNHPDTYIGTNWASTTGGDNGGVHTNSGILNHWFYLLTVGSSGTDQINDKRERFSVRGIGIDKASKIVFRAETRYLRSNSDYNAARTAMIRAARDLHGNRSNEERAVTNAWQAVGVGSNFDNNVQHDGYCIPLGTTTFNGISNVRFVTIDHGGSTSNSYSDFTSESTDLDRGSSPNINISTIRRNVRVYIDYNQNEIFESNEMVASSSNQNINRVPANALLGRTRMRIIAGDNNNLQACLSEGNISTRDYSVVIKPMETEIPSSGNYCAITGVNSTNNFISSVSIFVNSNNNLFKQSSASTFGYSNFTSESVDLTAGNRVNFTINATGNVGYGIWIDYNQDNDFNDPGEHVFRSSSSSSTTSFGDRFTIPTTARNGRTTMRIIVRNGQVPTSPCDTFNRGEIEDYSVGISGGSTNTQPTCNDNIQNGTETGVDCGGSSCSPCNDNTNPGGGGNVVFVNMADQTANASGNWRSFRIQVGDDNSFGAWFTQNQLRLVANSKDVVCNGSTSNITFLGEGLQVGPTSNFVNNSHSYLLGSSSYTSWKGRSGYIGFRFMINQQVHYGWFHVTVANDGLSYTITDYAYNETAGLGLTTTRNSANAKNTNADVSFTISPNPIKNGILQIQARNFDFKSYKIINMLGQTVQKGSYTNQIDVTKLKTGFYLLNIDTINRRFLIE